jgi:hypothetical protein
MFIICENFRCFAWKMPTYLTPNRHGYSVRFSPFQPDRLVCATSQYYGLAGLYFFLLLCTIIKRKSGPYYSYVYCVLYDNNITIVNIQCNSKYYI